jgi:ribosomal RNA assembly protein
MKTIFSDKLPRIIKNKLRLEKILNVKIKYQGKEISIKGEPEDEYIAEKVIDALNMGFPFSTAMLIKKEDYVLEIMNIKDYTKRHDLETIRGRIIGKQGRTLQTLHQLTNAHFEIKDNQVGIISLPENLESAQEALISIIKGSKQSNVYSYLEKHKTKEITDFGLKDKL